MEINIWTEKTKKTKNKYIVKKKYDINYRTRNRSKQKNIHENHTRKKIKKNQRKTRKSRRGVGAGREEGTTNSPLPLKSSAYHGESRVLFQSCVIDTTRITIRIDFVTSLRCMHHTPVCAHSNNKCKNEYKNNCKNQMEKQVKNKNKKRGWKKKHICTKKMNRNSRNIPTSCPWPPITPISAPNGDDDAATAAFTSLLWLAAWGTCLPVSITSTMQFTRALIECAVVDDFFCGNVNKRQEKKRHGEGDMVTDAEKRRTDVTDFDGRLYYYFSTY